MTLTFDDAASADIHGAHGAFNSAFIGTFQPSGRNIHPLTPLDTTAHTAALSTFAGDPAAGEYRLYIADVATGDTATLVRWSLTLTGQAIPEPGAAALGALVGLTLLRRRRQATAASLHSKPDPRSAPCTGRGFYRENPATTNLPRESRSPGLSASACKNPPSPLTRTASTCQVGRIYLFPNA